MVLLGTGSEDARLNKAFMRNQRITLVVDCRAEEEYSKMVSKRTRAAEEPGVRHIDWPFLDFGFEGCRSHSEEAIEGTLVQDCGVLRLKMMACIVSARKVVLLR